MDNESKIKALSDDELDSVTGGINPNNLMKIQCSCGTVNTVDVTKPNFICKMCKKINYIVG